MDIYYLYHHRQIHLLHQDVNLDDHHDHHQVQLQLLLGKQLQYQYHF
tara:strand:- start:172 stop:312 length:141 start_codon:yes stop_codon:yes gene_type:complete